MTDQPQVIEKPSPTGGSVWMRIGIFFAIFAILILMGGFAYSYFEISRVNIQLAQLAKVLQKREMNSQQDISGLQNTVNAMQQSLQKTQTLSTQQEQFMTEWRAVQAGDLNKWHLVQAQYLVKMANDQLQFNHNLNIAMQLLQQADKELQSSQDAALLEVRKSLATDIANLQAQPPVDVTSLFLRLNALNELVDKLPLPIQPLMADQQKSTPDKQDSKWKAGLASFWQGLNKIVIIRKNDSSALPLVMPDEKIFLYQNLHAQFENASFGLLHENATVYTTSLARAAAWIQHYFAQDAQETKSLLQQLAELQKINIQVSTISLANTLQLLNGDKGPEKTGQ